MKKSVRIFVALMAFLSLSVASLFAQSSNAPTVSTASIYIRYCETVEKDTALTIPSILLPYYLQENIVLNVGTNTVIYQTSRGCDSIVNYRVTPKDYYFVVNNNNKKVVFSRGNLQYHATSNSWRFAEHQYTVIGNKNINISYDYDGWIDLFGYATSGYKHSPFLASFNSCDYYHDKTTREISCTDYDWAWYNKIDNGGNIDPAGTWYTMPKSEWEYILLNRTDKKGLATIVNVKGLILIPDNYDGPTINTQCNSFDNNEITRWQDWYAMELKGAIFLPVTGSREKDSNNKMIINNTDYGRYWTSTNTYINNGDNCTDYSSYRLRIAYYDETAKAINYTIDASSNYAAWIGYAVRPVKVVQ